MKRASAVLLLALAFQLWLAPARGHIHDIAQFKAWTQTLVTAEQPLAIYSVSTANYPPLALFSLAWMGKLYQALFSPEWVDSDTLTALLKLPAIAANLITGLVIFRLLRPAYGERSALRCLALYVFNPAVWYATAWWGQLESLYTLPMLLSVAALAARRPAAAWGWLAVGVLVKPQAAVLAPLVLLASWRIGGWRAWRRGGVTAALVLAVVLAPLIWVGQLPVLWAQLSALAGRQLFLTMNAHNFWYLVTLGRGSFAAREMVSLLDNQPWLGSLTGWQVGLGLLAGWTLFVSGRFWLAPWRRSRIYLTAAALVLGFFILPAEAHERYLFPVLALLAPLLPSERIARWLYGILSLTLWLNLLWVDPAVPWPHFAGVLYWGVPLALLNTSSLLIVAHRLKRWA